MSKHKPVNIRLRQKSRFLDIEFEDGKTFSMSCEFLRVHSPSAEVMGHGGPGKLQEGKENVNISAIDPVGLYAVRLCFDDKHQSGIFSWDYLYDLGEHQSSYWRNYLRRLTAEGGSRTTCRR